MENKCKFQLYKPEYKFMQKKSGGNCYKTKA